LPLIVILGILQGMFAVFQNQRIKLVITEHARQRMSERDISMADLLHVLETGTIQRRAHSERIWIYKTLHERAHSNVCLSLAIEKDCVVIITVLVNWSPQ
jgi:hypothetical protein